MSEIIRPQNRQEGWAATWIEEDHNPGPGEDYDCAYAEYAYHVFTDEAEAKKALADNYLSGGVEWGYIAPAVYEYGGWSEDFDAQQWYYDICP